LYALVDQSGGLIGQLHVKMNIDTDMFKSKLRYIIEGMPREYGPGREPGKVYIAQDVDRILVDAENQADRMKDEYVSVEHIMLSLLNNPKGGLRNLYNEFGLNKDKFLNSLSSVRGNTRVTSDTPE